MFKVYFNIRFVPNHDNSAKNMTLSNRNVFQTYDIRVLKYTFRINAKFCILKPQKIENSSK